MAMTNASSSSAPAARPGRRTAAPSSSGRRRRRGRPVAARAAGNDGAPPPPPPNNEKKPSKALDPERDSWDDDDDQSDELRAQLEAERAAERAVERLLDPAWRELKAAAQRELRAAAAADGSKSERDAAAAEAARVGNMSLSEALEGDRLLRSLAESELGPVLESMGLPRSQALPFLYELVRTAALVQLGAAAAVFYGGEVFFALDAGAAWRCVCGLGVGYLSRLFIPVEALAWPLYDWLVRAATGGRGYYQPSAFAGEEQERERAAEEAAAARRRRQEAAGSGGGGEEGESSSPAASASSSSASAPPLETSAADRPYSQREQARSALARLGVLVGGALLLPPALLGWSRAESAWQFALPALAGALAFDAAYLVALVLKLRESEGGGGGDEF